MIGLYTRLLARCRTINQINQVHIALGDRITPLELDDLHGALAPHPPERSGLLQSLPRPDGLVAVALRRLRPKPAFPPESRAWVEEMSDWAGKSGNADPEPFLRRRVRAHVVSFSNGVPSAGKTLVICFTGRSRRLFVPIPVALQHLSAERFDLLVLRDLSRNGYRHGLAGVAADFPGVVAEIGRMFDRSDYRAVVTYGTSSGGLPAILAALRLGLDKGISVGGKGPGDPRWPSSLSGGVRGLIVDALRGARAAPNLLQVFGADSAPDVESARSLAQVVPLHTLAVHGLEGRTIGHNPLHPLLRRGRLRAFLETALDADVAGFGSEGGREISRLDV